MSSDKKDKVNQSRTGAKAIDVFDVRSDIKIDQKKTKSKQKPTQDMLGPITGKKASNHPIQEEITHDSMQQDSVDLANNISKLDQILEAELDTKGVKKKGAKMNSADVMSKDGKIFPYEEEMYQGGANDSNLKSMQTLARKNSTMQNNAVRKRRVDLQDFILDAEKAESQTTSARLNEIEKIKERIKAGEVTMQSVSRTRYKRINKKFKRMTPEEKKLHVKYLWSRIRLSIIQKNTMKFLGKNVLESQKKKIFSMKSIRKKEQEHADNVYNEFDEDQETESTALVLPWYMIHEEGKFMVFWQFIFANLVLINYLYAPFITAFSNLR